MHVYHIPRREICLWRKHGIMCHIRRYSSATDQRISLAYDLYKPSSSNKNVLHRKSSPIIFMHGLFGSKKNNRSMSKVLASDLNTSVYAVDLRNHGDTAHHPKHDYLELAMDVEAFIQKHKLRDVTLIGHSMGAKTALTLALRSPEIVSKVIAIDNAPVRLPLTSDFPRYVKGMLEIESAKVKSISEADKILKQYEESSSIRLFLLTNLIHIPRTNHLTFRIPLNILAASFDALGDFPFSDSRSTRFDKPVLTIRALQSHYISDNAFPLIESFFPQSKIIEFDCGHWVITDKPHEFRRAAVEFLRPSSST